MLATQAVDAGATALPASPTRSCTSPGPGLRPLGGRDGSLRIWPELGTPLVPLIQAGALVRRKGPLPIPGYLPRVPRSPDPKVPKWGASQDAPHPKALSCNPRSPVGKRRPREGKGRSAHAQLREPPWALTLQPMALSCTAPHPLWPCLELQLELSWESAPEEERKLPLWAGGALGVAPASSLPSP